MKIALTLYVLTSYIKNFLNLNIFKFENLFKMKVYNFTNDKVDTDKFLRKPSSDRMLPFLKSPSLDNFLLFFLQIFRSSRK